MNIRIPHVALAGLLALGAGAGVARSATTCGGQTGDYQHALSVEQNSPSLFVTVTAYVGDPTQPCVEVSGEFLVWGTANTLISFEACGATHYYHPRTDWLTVVADCDDLAIATL